MVESGDLVFLVTRGRLLFGGCSGALATLLVCAPVIGAASPGQVRVVFEGQMFGTSISVAVFNGPGNLRHVGESGCREIDVSTDGLGSQGCAAVAGASAGLAGYGLVCDGHGRFLYGLVSHAAFRVRAIAADGRTVGGRVRSLPARWRANARAWLLALRRTRSLRSVEAIDRHGAVVAAHRFSRGELQCPSPAAVVRGRPHRDTKWRFLLEKTRGAGAIANICTTLDVTLSLGPFSEVDGSVHCTPVGLLGHALLIDPSGAHSVRPSYAIFTGLLSPRVLHIEVVLADGRRLTGQIIRLTRSAHVPVNAFVAATRRESGEVAYIYRTTDGRTHRSEVPPGVSALHS